MKVGSLRSEKVQVESLEIKNEVVSCHFELTLKHKEFVANGKCNLTSIKSIEHMPDINF